MSLDFDATDQELQLFLAENNDHLQLLDQNIVKLETNPDDQSLLQSIFRSAHTIKGGAGLIGHQRMAQLAHAMENVLDGLRAGTLRVTPSMIDVLLVSLDGLRLLNHEVITRTPSSLVLDELVDALQACIDDNASSPAVDVVEVAVTTVDGEWGRDPELVEFAAEISPDTLFEVTVNVDPDSGLSAARIFQAYLELEEATRILRSVPPRAVIETDETVCSLRALIVTAEPPGDLEERLARIADVVEVRVEATAVVAAPERRETDRRQLVRRAEDREGGAESTRATVDKMVAHESSIRISVTILDNLMSLVSELVLGRTRLQTLRNQLMDRYRDDESVLNLEDAVGHLDRISNDLQTTVMKARMLPVENVFNKFPRLMRDLSAHSGKQVSFSMSGQETELDRSVIEQLSDPLTHLLRNAIDHGIETPEERVAAGKAPTGSITLSATPNENHILIEVTDDGRGIDGPRVKAKAIERGLITPEAAERLSERETIELIFAPGLSTARTVTDISGRGVGMDIVKSTIERMGGHVQVETKVGEGTTYSITLPLTLAIMQALLVSVDNAVYALPLNMVTEILSVPEGQIQMLQHTEATLLRGTILPLVRLRDFFGCGRNDHETAVHVVATKVDGHYLGLVVDSFIGEQEIVMKPLGRYMGTVRGLAGATILGDGRIGLLVDVAAIREWTPASPKMAA